MGRVTGSTNGGYGEALPEQAFAVHTHRVVLDDIFLRDLVSTRYGRAFLVTGAAKQRHVHYCCWRTVVRRGQDIVFAMTVGTGRRQWIAVFCGYTMQTTFVRIGLGPVATAAVDQLQIFACGVPAFGRVQVRVTFHAGYVVVDGCRVSIFRYEDRNILTCKRARELGVGVTLEAIVIVLGQCGCCREPEDRGRSDKPTSSVTTAGARTHRHYSEPIADFRVRNILIAAKLISGFSEVAQLVRQLPHVMMISM